ncbi:hypothetical protein MSAN_00320400 [Mycena sanguinolenta]|uniref:Uncharacterized protein n=1 Tax=Mycena sanguinolenta TaxID=230812 RepID=A0A8H7DGB0_9AGAR|nr:hypothetical protein MSAN_00320400 [Mycena sanguinolenta]
MAQDITDDPLDDFIHSYFDSEYDGQAHSNSFDEEDGSGSESGSEPPESIRDEEEDMALYDLYDNSTRPSPQPPSSPVLEDGRLELDSMLDHIAEDFKHLGPEWRSRHKGQTTFASPACVSSESNLGKFFAIIPSIRVLNRRRCGGRRLLRERNRTKRRREKPRIAHGYEGPFFEHVGLWRVIFNI